MDIRPIVVIALTSVAILTLRSDIGRTSFPAQGEKGINNESATLVIKPRESPCGFSPGVCPKQLLGFGLEQNRPRSLEIEELE